MKIKVMILSCLISVVILFMGYEYSWADAKAGKPPLKIAIVSVQKIFRDSKRSVRYRQEAAAELSRIRAELDKLRAELEADEAGLKTLKIGSSDHMAQVKEILTKQGSLQAQQKFYEQQMVLKQRRMVEKIYKDILRETGEIAKQKGLGLVFEKSEPELSALSSKELDDTISTHKLLYSGGCLDITDELMARLDAKK